MTEEIETQQTAADTTSAVPFAQEAITGGARSSAEIETRPPEINRYLFENLVSNVECQIEYWSRKAAREPNPETAQTLRNKAEGLGYALRLLDAFAPEFVDLTEAALRFASDRRTHQ